MASQGVGMRLVIGGGGLGGGGDVVNEGEHSEMSGDHCRVNDKLSNL